MAKTKKTEKPESEATIDIVDPVTLYDRNGNPHVFPVGAKNDMLLTGCYGETPDWMPVDA